MRVASEQHEQGYLTLLARYREFPEHNEFWLALDMPEQKVTVPVDPAMLSAYQATVGDVVPIKLTLTDGRLYLQADPFGAELVELFPESESQFFA